MLESHDCNISSDRSVDKKKATRARHLPSAPFPWILFFTFSNFILPFQCHCYWRFLQFLLSILFFPTLQVTLQFWKNLPWFNFSKLSGGKCTVVKTFLFLLHCTEHNLTKVDELLQSLFPYLKTVLIHWDEVKFAIVFCSNLQRCNNKNIWWNTSLKLKNIKWT